jgi:hypothetical protein
LTTPTLSDASTTKAAKLVEAKAELVAAEATKDEKKIAFTYKEADLALSSVISCTKIVNQLKEAGMQIVALSLLFSFSFL